MRSYSTSGLFSGLCPDVERSVLGSMVADFEVAVSYLKSAQPSERIGALTVLYHHWKRLDHFSAEAEKMAYLDPDINVRCTAILYLGSCHRNTRDSRISRLLARSISDEREEVPFRRMAYEALVQVQGRSDKFPPVEEKLDSLVGVDWKLVQDLQG